MSYILSMAPEARAALAKLDPWLAEETLDEIEKFLENTDAIRLRPGQTIAVYDFTRDMAGTLHYVFISVRPIRSEATLEILNIGYARR